MKHEARVPVLRDLVALGSVLADAADEGHEDARLASDVCSEVPAAAARRRLHDVPGREVVDVLDPAVLGLRRGADGGAALHDATRPATFTSEASRRPGSGGLDVYALLFSGEGRGSVFKAEQHSLLRLPSCCQSASNQRRSRRRLSGVHLAAHLDEDVGDVVDVLLDRDDHRRQHRR